MASGETLRFATPPPENNMAMSPRRALIVIDVQNEYFDDKLPIEFPSVEVSLPNITLAMHTAQSAGIPVIVVQQDSPEGSPAFAKGSHGWQLHPAIAEFVADYRLNKSKASAFTGTELAQWLSQHAIDTVTIVGYMTHNCDAATIYQASHEGLKVEFLADATGTLPYENAAGKVSAEEMHRVFSTVFHSNFAAVTSTETWVAAVREGSAFSPDNVYQSNLRAREARVQRRD
jgi:nicotinamidase-related amidase